jgi:hypothetical protein
MKFPSKIIRKISQLYEIKWFLLIKIKLTLLNCCNLYAGELPPSPSLPLLEIVS